jgi:tetratricopeptide (TPR) repeat protein
MTLRLSILAVLSFCAGCGADSRAGLLPGENYSRKDALAGIEQGKLVLVALLRFEADTGCWPHDLSELVPEYVAADDINKWRYRSFGHDDFALVYLGPLAGGILRYNHDAGKSDSWNVWWEDQDEQQHSEKIDVESPEPPASTFTPDQKAGKRLALLHRRIDTWPERITHRIGLMKHYFDLEQFENARAVCVACIEKWPDYWWSYLMLAKIEGRLVDRSDSERRLKALAARWSDFFGYAFLAQFYFDRSDFEKSKAALRRALEAAPTRHKDQYSFEQIGYRQEWVDDCYYHNAAYLAYRMGDHPLCLAICDRWQGFVREVQRYGGEEERALRIVCAVNEADWDRAAKLLRAMKELPDHAAWQDQGIQTLERVAREKNDRYEYDPKLFRPTGVPLGVEFDYK